MENNEKLDWKPEVGKTAWLKRYHDTIEQVMITNDFYTKLHYKQMTQIGEGEVAEYDSAEDRDYFFESLEAALSSIKIYDLEGKEVLIPRADEFSGEKVLGLIGLQMENDLLKKPVTTLAQAQMLLYEHGMILDLSGLSPILIERGGAAIGGKSEPKRGRMLSMSIEETYKGMWSSDATLLKSLLDAGETILFDRDNGIPDHQARMQSEGKYEWTNDGFHWDVFYVFAEMDSGSRFLIPPRPLVLEPKPLEWTEVDDENGECLESKDGLFWDFWCWSNGDWGIELDGAIVAENTSKGNFDTAKAAIHEWRVNHLKSMLS